MYEVYKIAFCIPFLLIACYYDLKFREIPNKLWLVMLPGIIAFLTNDFMSSSFNAVQYLYPAITGILTTYLIYHFKGYGGADAKILMLLSVIIPYHLNDSLQYPFLYNIFSLSVLSNALIITSTYMAVRFIANNKIDLKTPANIPFLIPITISYFYTILYGDLILNLIY